MAGRIFITGWLLLLLASCSGEAKKKERPFGRVLNFDEEIARLDSSDLRLVKTAYYNDQIETRHINHPDWEVELKPFVEADFNRPANRDNYLVKEKTSKLAGITEVAYIAKREDAQVRWAVYRFTADTTPALAAVDVMKEERPYSMEEVLLYLPHTGYAMFNNQKLELVFDEHFAIEAFFVPAAEPWRFFFDAGEENIPVNARLSVSGNGVSVTIVQASEQIELPVTLTDSGFVAEFPVFNTYLVFDIDDDTIRGDYYNPDKGPAYKVPFTGYRMPLELLAPAAPDDSIASLEGKWETYFGTGDDLTPAIGIFEQLGDDLYGSFATETGDYRFLQGKITGDSFYLSTLDGIHLFLFKGKIKGDSIVNGRFYSGNHYQTTWKAVRNNEFELRPPDELTRLKPGYEKPGFTFPDPDGNPVSLSDERFRDKVVIVQIMGTWCPNCMDETRYFVELYDKYHEKGLEIVSLAFERPSDFEQAAQRVRKAVADLHIPYPVLIAGTPKDASKALPMLEKIMSFPTAVFIDRNGNVVKIHTGFYGPGTGSYYDEYVTGTERLINELLND